MMVNGTAEALVDAGEKFVLETDQAPEFWQFLNGLRGDDLLVELIVNDLDARSPRTEIRFEVDQLVCVGTGAPVDDEGWARLRKIKGAGHAVKAKVGLFGVKNHGLKACFTLGDDITVRSNGKQIRQTLFAEGPDSPAFPGVRVPPRDDPEAPEIGTQIEVPYRRTPFVAPHGETLSFAAATDEDIRAFYEEAVRSLPKRLLGIIRPGVLEQYTLAVSHHELGCRTFAFSCGPIKRNGGLVTFFRECHELGPFGDRLLEREQAALSVWAPSDHEGKPRYFQTEAYEVRGKRLFEEKGLVIEVAWAVDARGRLAGSAGTLRYPVAYPPSAAGGVTGMGLHYSGPFTSDTERHDLAAQSKAWNTSIIGACDNLAAKALATLLLKRHGPEALELVSTVPEQERLKSFAKHLLEDRVFPAVDRRGQVAAVKKGARLAVPVYTNAGSDWAEKLAAVAPADVPMLHPNTPRQFVALLASAACPGWGVSHVTFDEADVIDHLERTEAENFPWRSEAERRRELSDAATVRGHLDAIYYPALADMGPKRASGAQVELPDGDGRLHSLSDLRRGTSLPADIVGLDVPPVIHPKLKDHSILKLDGWKLDLYSLRDLLRDGRVKEQPAAVRKRFFTWLTKNPHQIPRDDWPMVKSLPVWPASDGVLVPFEALCAPERRLASLLGVHVHRPTKEVRAFCASNTIRRARLGLREEPIPEEVIAFYQASVAAFPLDRPLSIEERASFLAFERSLAELAGSPRAVRALTSLADGAVALSRAGTLRPVGSLVRETPDIARLKLADRDLLERPRADLDRILPPAKKVTAAMALNALRGDPKYAEALLPRLRLITASLDLMDAAELSQIRCIPFEGSFKAPDELAFKGNQGDFWGEWKSVIGAAGLADDAQELYRAAGVVRSFPTSASSRLFFAWLNAQPAGAVARNLDSVMRHLAHKNGVGSWLLEPPEVPCIPVEAPGGVELLRLSEARKQAAVDDFPELAEAIRDDMPNAGVRLAIHSVKSSTQPVADQLRSWGIPLLSSLAKGPGDPRGEEVTEAPPRLMETLRGLTSSAAGRRFRKQLAEFDVKQNQIEPLFHKRLTTIKRIAVASDLTVQFRVRRRSYRTHRAWAVLQDAIWLDASGDLSDRLMKAIADIVFVEPRPRYLRSVLRDALAERARDFRPSQAELDLDADEDEPGENEDGDVGEATKPHPGADPDPSRNKPNPKDLFTGAGKGKKDAGKPVKERPKVEAEDIQRRQLKKEHYACHCQMELATRSPEELAPAGSYVQHAENRVKIMEAHHPDKVGTNGSRHAGNLLILSRTNHEKLGTRLSRQDVTEALSQAWTPRSIRAADGSTWLEGGVAAARDKITGETLPLFFTHKHRAYWLKMAGVATGSGKRRSKRASRATADPDHGVSPATRSHYRRPCQGWGRGFESLRPLQHSVAATLV